MNILQMKTALNKNLTGKVPGRDASKKDTKELGGAAKWTWDPEKSLELEAIWHEFPILLQLPIHVH